MDYYSSLKKFQKLFQEELDPLSAFHMNESERRWMEGTLQPLNEDAEEELSELLNKDVTADDVREVLGSDEESFEDEDFENIATLINKTHEGGRPSDINDAYQEIRRIIRIKSNFYDDDEYSVGRDSYDPLEVRYFVQGDMYDATIIYDPYLETIGILDLGTWVEKAEQIHASKLGDDREQGEDDYIDWFNPSNYKDTEEAIEAAIRIASKSKRKDLSYGPMFPEPRTYVDLKGKDIEVEEDIIPDDDVLEKIHQAGYEIESYRKGIAKKRDGNRKIKIGKLLKNDPNLKKKFDERLGGKKINPNKLQMVFSYEPRDIATMSTGRGWTSCADFEGSGPAAEQIPNKIKFGGMVIYLINHNDKNIEHPIARISVRRFIDKKDGSFVLLPEKACYGAEVDGFEEQVQEFLSKSNKQTMRKQMASLIDAEGGYSDSFGDLVFAANGKTMDDMTPQELLQVLKKSKVEDLVHISEPTARSLIVAMSDRSVDLEDVVPVYLHLDKYGYLSETSPRSAVNFLGFLAGKTKESSDTEKDKNEKYLDIYVKHLFYILGDMFKTVLEHRFVETFSKLSPIVWASIQRVNPDYQLPEVVRKKISEKGYEESINQFVEKCQKLF